MTPRHQVGSVPLVLVLALLATTSSTSAQAPGPGGWTIGKIGKPIPATDSKGRGAPGCFVAFSAPDWSEDDEPDLPCAVWCSRPLVEDAVDLEAVRRACREAAPTFSPDSSEVVPATSWDVHETYWRRKFAPGQGPPGSATCSIMGGPRGYPNWTTWFPRGHPACGGVTGDPHVTTFDEVRYDLQAAGEFVAVESLDDNLQVQLRLEPMGGEAQASVVTAAAARMGTHRITVTAGGRSPLRLDGDPLVLEDGMFHRLFEAGGAIVRTLNRYSVVWRDGTNLHVDVFRGHLNVHVLAAEPRDGRLAGLLGNAGGDGGANDFRTRDGRPLASPPAFEQRYRVFADSWRVRSDESLFDYRQGESTETFTRRDFPARDVTLSTIDASARARADAACREGGVHGPEALEDCVFDVAVTGDDDYVASAASREPSPELRPAAPDASRTSSATVGGITLVVPREAIASFPVEVRISGPTPPRDTVAIAREGSPDREHVTQVAVGEGPDERTLRLVARNESGRYEFRYKTAESGWREATMRLPFVARDPVARLEAPGTAPAGGSVRVRCAGECSPLAYINLVPAGSPDDLLGAHAYLSRGPDVTILYLPKEPGEYEIRYLAHANPRRVFARVPIRLQ